jgi:pyruvate dehydrogenase E1 component alpha subunit
MHLFSKEHLAASSGIVGASGPAAAGFGLAAQRLRPGTLAVAFFGEGAMNQGMLLEAMNLAVVWELPVLFVCKDNGWCISTPASSVVGGSLIERARGFGMPAVQVDGTDVVAMWREAREAMQRARKGGGPTFLHALCVHLEGHFLGDAMVDIPRRPVREMLPMVWPMTRSFLRIRGAPLRERIASLRMILSTLVRSGQDLVAAQERDPLNRTRKALASEPQRLQSLETEVAFEIAQVVEAALLSA